MIGEETLFFAVCDRCAEADDDVYYWPDAGLAIGSVLDSGWHWIGDRLICDMCVVWDEEADELVEKPKS